MCIQFEFVGDEFKQFLFYFDHIFPGCQTGAVADAEDVCVDGDGGLAEGGVEDHVGGFASHSCFKLFGG